MKCMKHLWLNLRSGIIVFIVIILLPLGGVKSDETHLISSGRDAVTFEINVPTPVIVPSGEGGVRVLVPGFGSFSPPGAPELPGKIFNVAVPQQGSVRMTASILEEEALGVLELARVPGERLIRGDRGIPSSERYFPPDPWAGKGMPPVVSECEPCFMGRQRVLPVRVNPLVSGDGGFRLVRKLSITVHFEGGKPVAGSISPPSIPESGTWQRLYKDLLVNPEDVSRFRKPLTVRRFLRRPLEEGKRLRLYVPKTGIYAVRADSLIESGLSAALSTGQFALKKLYYDEGESDLVREVDIPMLVLESGSTAPGILDGADVIIFHARGIRDDTDAGDPDAKYTNDNVIWLEEDAAGEYMEELPPLPQTPGYTPPNSRFEIRVARDGYYHKRTRPGSTDYYFMKEPEEERTEYTFEIHNPAAGSNTFDLSLRVQGFYENRSIQRCVFSINSEQVGIDSVYSNDSAVFTFNGNPAGWLVDGTNRLTVETDVDYGLLINDFTINYPRLFVAHEDMFEFSIGTAILPQTIDITGFTVDHGVLVEMTDPSNPLYHVLSSEYFSDAGGGNWTLSVNLQPSLDYERRFVVLGAGAGEHIYNSGIVVDEPSDLVGEAGPFNTLIISHGEFLDELQSYIDWRKAQGYRILTANVQDVYDEFNGGLPNCDAIRRFIAFGVDHWGVEFVLLVGDGNEDQKEIYDKTPTNFIPPYTFAFNVIGSFPDEVVSTDRYYSFLDETVVEAAGIPDFDTESGTEGALPDPFFTQGVGYPDVFLGRISAGEDYELRALLIKMYGFEEPAVDELWRRKIILFADDAWSGRLNYYRYVYGEERFEWSMSAIGDSIEAALPGGLDIYRLPLARWTDEAHKNPDGDPGSVIYARTQDSVSAYFTPYLLKLLNEGCLFFSFQGHGNRSTLTTEGAFASLSLYDHLDSLRTPIPNIFTAFGCHISEFARLKELSWVMDGKNGDCITEQLLLKPRAGSVGTYASTGYEYLSDNAVLCERLHEEIFQGPPVDSVPPRREYTGARWILGEVITKGEIRHIQNSGYGLGQVFRYVLLGDPMLNIDPGPPLMQLEADWGSGWVSVPEDSFRAREGTNDCTLRFEASDVVALEGITLEVDGENWTDSLDIEALKDTDRTFARAYRAELDYSISLDDEYVVFRVFKPDSQLAGVAEYPIDSRIRLFYNEYLEIAPGVECPPTGMFKLTVDFPAYIDQQPVLILDGLKLDEAVFTVPDRQDSLHWETVFSRTFPSGRRVLSVHVGEYSKDFEFHVTGDDLVVEAFNFPNPFRDGTNIVYTLNLPVDAGTIEIYNVSGLLIRTLRLPGSKLDASNFLTPHSIYWNGRDMAGDPVANGTYIYVLKVDRGGSTVDIKGKSVKLE